MSQHESPRARRSLPSALWPLCAFASAVLPALPLAAQTALQETRAAVNASADATSSVRRTVTPEDYGRFESLGQLGLSADGRWIAVTVSRADEDGEVRFGQTTADELRVIERGARAEFSSDNAWLAVAIAPPRDREGGGPAQNDLLLIATASGEEHEVEGIQSFAFSPDGRFLLMRRYRAAGGGGGGAAGGRGGAAGGAAGGANNAPAGVDVLVRDLASGTDVSFGNVSESSWSEAGALLATITDAVGQAGNGVRLYDPATGRIRTLHAANARYHTLTWREDASDLAVLRVDPDTVRGDTIHTVLAWRNALRDDAVMAELSGAFTAPDGRELRTSDLRDLDWSDDGSRIFFAVQERSEEREADETEGDARGDGEGPGAGRAQGGRGDDDGPGSPGVEIWHALDVDPIPQQKLSANQDRRRSALATWDLRAETPVVLGGDGLEEGISLLPGQRHALLTDEAPYAEDRMFGPVFRDMYLVDVTTGARERVLERVENAHGTSPTGRYLLSFEDGAFWVHDVQSGETRNITASLTATFANQETDRPVTEVIQRPSYGVGGWTEGDEWVLLYDRFDVWRVRPDGSAGERLTNGAEQEIRHRLVRLDPDMEAFPEDGPWTLSLYGEYTKESGYGRLRPGRAVERLVYEPRDVGRLTQSEDGRTVAFVTEKFDQSPAVHVAAADLSGARQITRTNAFADEFAWGEAQLVDYENAWGRKLQGALYYPADYVPGRQYPMIVYHYELRSQQLHAWSNPAERPYNLTVYTQNGYFVLQPDIVYRPRNPGLSFMEAVIPAVDAAIATGMIDPEKVGITGHSWGGYQTAFAATQTDRFAAAIAGAPLTNLESMYLSFYWNSGSTDARIFEISQGRMEVPWWEDPEAYRANSPLHHIQNMTTPLLMQFGTDDGAVEFNQGVEFYNAARRLGKDFVLLVYEGENHNLAREPNQIDYHRRSLDWFNHYLKGAPAPSWITEGMPYIDQQDEIEKGPNGGRQPVVVPATVSSTGSDG